MKPPRAYRAVERALVAGVAAGIAAHFRVPVWVIRSGFILLCAWKLSGAVAYAVLWAILAREEKSVPIGLVAAERQGRRTVIRKANWPQILGWVGSCLVVLGIAYVITLYDSSWVGRDAVFIATIGIGIAIVWLTRDATWPRWWKILTSLIGILLAWSGGTVVLTHLWDEFSIDVSAYILRYLAIAFAAGAAMIACGIGFLPWIIHPKRTEEDKQAELIAQTRADIAAHLHDSVLQTLAVIQKKSTDAKAVAQLARHQEKELREWLYSENTDEESMTTALKEVIAELESTYPVAVELVTVGDHEMTVELDAVVRAAREAILNAAKHSGADKIDVYAEISVERAEAYIRDRGRGFKTEDIGEDRMGIRGSIIDRMTRYGGTVDIRSTEGEGTEIRLSMPLDQEGSSYD